MDLGAFEASVDGQRPAKVRLVGELDLAGVPELRAALAGLDGDVELDCSALTFIDATGLRGFQEAESACDGRGCELVLVDPSPAVDRVLRMVGLDNVFRIRRSRELA